MAGTSSSSFPRLDRDDVRRLAKTIGLPIEEQDLDEVRFRLNALAEALALLDDEELSKVDPLPLMIEVEEQ